MTTTYTNLEHILDQVEKEKGISKNVLIEAIEAALLSAAGGVAGIAVAVTLGAIVRLALPAVPFATPPAYAAAALGMAVAVGLLAGVVPARSTPCSAAAMTSRTACGSRNLTSNFCGWTLTSTRS